jgi:acyl carrier protein
MAAGEIAKFGGGTVGGGDWRKRSCGNSAGEKGSEGGCGETNSAVGEARGGVGGVDLHYGEGGGGGSLGIGEEKMKTLQELGELVRQAVAETLRKKGGVLEGQRLGADLGAESIDRIDLTFRLEEAVGKALDEKILFAEPDPTLAELAARLAKMIEGKK